VVSGATRDATKPAASASERARPSPRPRRGPIQRLRRSRPNPVAAIGALIWLVIVGLPLYVLVTTTLQTSNDYVGTLSWPSHPTLANYKAVFRSGFAKYFVNSTIVTLATVVIVLALVVPLAFTIVRSRSRLTGLAFRFFVFGLAIPAQATIIPLYLLISKMHLYDSLLAIILPTAAFSMPVCVLVLVGSMRDIPEELYEAMALDGASPARMFVQLVLPLSRGGIATAGMYSALLQAWNGLIFPLILTQSDSNRVLTLGLYNFIGEFRIDIPALLSAVLLSGVPIFVAYLLARRALISSFVGIGK
jgi:xylobiose transport system permease protein